MVRCKLCNSVDTDNKKYGELLKKNKIYVHTFCLYLSSNLCQNGNDNNGLLAFLVSDIKRESKRVSELKCCYCGCKSANIACCNAKCRRSFHMICGINNGAQNQFVDKFKSFCHLHITYKDRVPPPKEKCCICYEQLIVPNEKFYPVNVLRAPCCFNGWFHKGCLQTFALTAGYFFKCPLCNDKNEFRKKLPYRGIYIPHR